MSLPDDLQRRQRAIDHAWHVAINEYHYPKDGGPPLSEHAGWMYEAKTLSQEVPRLVLLFGKARRGELAQEHRQCSRSEPEPLPVPNELTCCLGVKCAACPQLLALERTEGAASEDIDRIKAWTCAAHIASEGGDVAREGYVLTTDDRMFWDNVYESMAMQNPDDEAL
jgi:hypothetical protein